MYSIGYKEVDILWEIANFKIADKNMIMKNYNISKTELSDTLKKINDLLNWEKMNYLLDKRGYILFNNELSERRFKLESIIKFTNKIRREIIYLFLILSEKHFNLTKFTLRFGLGESSKKYVRTDLKAVLKELDIDYAEYRESKNPLKIIKRKIPNFEKTRKEYLINLFIKRFEKSYVYYKEEKDKDGKELNYPSKLIFEIIKEELKIKDLKFIFHAFREFYVKYNKLFSVKEKYEIFIYFISNLYNEKENTRKRITSKNVKMKEDNDYKLLEEMLDKISENENRRIYSYFKLKLYRLLLKKEKMNFDITPKKSKEIFYNNTESLNIKIAEEYVYQIAEENSKIEYYENFERLKTLFVLDLEYNEIIKNQKYLKDLMQLSNIIEVTDLGELSEKLNGKNEKNFEQVFLISKSEIQNMIKNYSDIPIYFFKINDKDRFGRKTGKLKRRTDSEKQLTEIRETITEYNRIK